MISISPLPRALLVAPIILAALAPLPASARDLGAFLAGRWGDAKADWSDQDSGWVYAPCAAGNANSDAAFTFSGTGDRELTAIVAPSQANAIRTTARFSIAGPHQGSIAGFEKAVLFDVSYSARNAYGADVEYRQVLAFVEEDKIALIDRDNPMLVQRLVRCKNR